MNATRPEPVAVTQSVISAEASVVALQAAVSRAMELGVRINVAVADSGGNLAGFLRMPGAFLQSIDIAIDKAYTAAGFGFSTKDWMKLIGHDEGMKLGFSARPRLVVFGGGLPIRVGGELIGGIGVSGASEAQDEDCARAALAALGAE
ncbi:MAG TPA: heme-binding protein [Zoogloea sp.]|uniref:GlcG/HbpS family heme-binding protein n=1 Tax=Zoogloea sp. TaxID=49181 RepID=UPI002C8FE99E|nr:heme-binding protein [Zoogloea sp.]HMV17187.1 heme-binding protein [Rhodocyclaceae bacterium]HMV64759.1 heme-binding protein [Rhodocyclaceae bacterium]HMW53449.1 heme-binding protein [Rhodocyclaceae bacterium]HMY49567.1 heme-binding protein [Rhodocyclaceae bacterium]HNA66550.1 heme-binding protein [Rhodocyclaceae bacterium]